MTESTTINVRPPVWALIAAVVLGGGFYLGGKSIETSVARHPPVTITVTGEGKVSGVPDTALLSFGVQTDRLNSAQAATDDLAKRMSEIIASLKKQGIDDKDVSTQSLSLYPIYDYQDGKSVPRGYQASQTLAVKVRDTAKVGDVLTLATKDGANQIGGVSFTIDDPESIRTQARGKAIEQAQKKAMELSNQLGGHLGKLAAFSENGGGYYPPIMYARDAMPGGVANEAKSLEVPTGDQDVTVNVTITYELR